MMNKKDSELFAALRKGDKAALSFLFSRHYDHLLHYGLKMARNDIIVEECIQELFLYLFEAKDRLGNVINVKAYLFSSLRRRILEKRKQEQQRSAAKLNLPGTPDIQFSPEDILINQEGEQIAHQRLYQALNELPERQREAIYLRYFNGLSTKEIAEVMGVTNQTVLNTKIPGSKSTSPPCCDSRPAINNGASIPGNLS